HLSLLLLPSYSAADPRYLHSFPTRRSSDLVDTPGLGPVAGKLGEFMARTAARALEDVDLVCAVVDATERTDPDSRLFETLRVNRSEEHTSELQSRVDLVCRLLLEKKKQGDTLVVNPVEPCGAGVLTRTRNAGKRTTYSRMRASSLEGMTQVRPTPTYRSRLSHT